MSLFGSAVCGLRRFPKLTLLFVLLAVAKVSLAQSITTANLGANQVTLQLTAPNAGKGYFTLLQGAASCGSAAQTVAGTNNAGTAVVHGSLTLTAGTAGQFTVRNLLDSTAYTVCFTPDGTTTPISQSFTTTDAASLSPASWASVGSATAFTTGFGAGSLAFSPDGSHYIAIQDRSNGSKKLLVMKFDGTQWTAVGATDLSTGAKGAGSMSMAFAPDGTPYVAYLDEDESFNYAVMVMKFSGSEWTVVGSGAVSPNGSNPTMSFAPDGTPYVAYSDAGNNYRATVMKFDGSTWTAVGGAGFTSARADYLSMALSLDGTPYVAFEDDGNNYKATVMKFDGTQWTVVGSAGVSTSTALYTVVGFAPDGTPYVAFADAGNTYKASVLKFDGSAWTPVGMAAFTPGSALNLKLAFDPDGMPSIFFTDGSRSSTVTAMRYDRSAWEALGSPGFSAGYSYDTALAYSPDGVPYVAYDSGGHGWVMSLQPTATPSAVTEPASAITSSSATLNGTVSDNGLATTVTFDYGITSSYGTSIAATTGGTIAAGTGSTTASVDLSGLTSNTTYHFRVNATANGNVVNGSDATFTTDKLTPSVTTWPTASTITYGQPLTASALTGGAAFIAGTFAWTTGTTLPTAGTASYSVTFTPTDAATYATISNTVSLIVNKATPTVSAWPKASSITTGQTLASSTLTGGTASVAGTFAWATPSTAVTGSGSFPVVFTPTDSADYESVTGSVSVSASQLTPAITLTSNVNPSLSQNPAVLTVLVSATGATPTGTVSLLDGNTTLGTETLSNGRAIFNLSSLTTGTHSITAVYSGDITFASVTSATVSQVVADFTFALSSTTGSSQTVAVGGTAKYTFSLAPSGTPTFPDAIQLSVSGLPSGATYTLTPATIVSGAATTDVTLSITIPNKTTMSSIDKFTPIAMGMLLLPFSGLVRRKGRGLARLMAMLLVLGGIAGLTGCGGSSPNPSSETGAPQNYTITITGGSGALQHSTTVTLTVQ